MTDSPPSPHRRSSNRRNSMLPSNNSLIGTSDSPTMVDWFSSAGALSSLSREEQDVLNSTCGGRRLSDISLNRLSNLVARRLSGCDNGISNDYACGSGMTMQNMMGVASLERLIAERRMSTLTMQDDMPSDFKLTAIENARRRRRSSMSQQSQGDFSQMSHFPRRKSLELVALENIARRRRSSMSQQSEISITTQQFQRECLEMAAEKATRINSLDLLGDVAALASSNSSTSTGAVPTNNVDGVGDILKNLTASGSPNRTSLDILSEASIALSVKNAHDNKILAQSLLGLSNKRQRFPYEQDEANQLFDDTLPPTTFPELGIDQCPPFGILQPTRTKGAQHQIQQQAQHQMKQPAQYLLKQRQQIQQQAQQEMKQQAQQQMQQQAQQEMKQQAQQQMQQQAQQEMNQQAQQQMQQQAQQEMKQQAQQQMQQQAQQEMKQQAQQQMQQQAQKQMQQQAQQEIKQQAQQQMQQQAQQQMQQQAQQEMKQQTQRQIQQQAQQQEMKQQAQQQMQHQNQRQIQHQAQQQMQQQAQQQMQQQAQQQIQQQNQQQMRRQAQQEIKQQAQQQMQQQAQQEMKQQVQEHRQRQAQQRLQQVQQQMQRQAQNNTLSSQAIQRNTNNPAKPFDELSHRQVNSINYSQPRQSASFLYGPQENESGNCKATNINTKIMPPPKESLTAQRLPIPQSPPVLKNSEPLIKDFSKSIQNSQKSQKNIQSWDKKMGLKRSHSATMTKTTQSRNQIKKFLESLSGCFEGSDLRKVGRSSKKKRKPDMGYLGSGFY